LIIIEKTVAGLSEDAVRRFVLRARRAAGLLGAVDVLLTSSAAMRSLNLQFRKKNAPTDVLSFPYHSSRNGSKRPFAGEIAICADIAVQNAAKLGHSPAIEVKILALHGILHLAGYDHERDNGKMARKEATLRLRLGLPSSLTERGGEVGRTRATLDRRSRSGPMRRTP